MPVTPRSVGIVGGGPSGLYLAKALLTQDEVPLSVTVYEAASQPFGLLRTGVAPDHEKARRAIRELTRLLAKPGIELRTGVRLGRDITRDDLLDAHDAVAYATGAPVPRLLQVPGENLAGIADALTVARWYTGSEDGAEPPLDGVTRAAVIGMGDVALDMARMLLKDTAGFAGDYMPAVARDRLVEHAVTHVTMVSIKGPQYCDLKTRDLVELLELPGVRVIVDPKVLDVDSQGLDQRVVDNLAALRAAADEPVEDARATLEIMFWRATTAILGETSVTGVETTPTMLDEDGKLVPIGEPERFEADVALRAIGSKGEPLPGIPFDERRGVIPTDEQRVVGQGVHAREYVVGWAKRGAVGGFGTARRDAIATAERILADFGAAEGADADDTIAELNARSVPTLSYEGRRV